MPVMHFHLRWPDGSTARCYSPSLVIKDYVQPGQSYTVPDFLQRMRQALNIASERVRAKYGFACSMAMGQLAQIEAQAAPFLAQHPTEQLAEPSAQPQALVAVIRFEE